MTDSIAPKPYTAPTLESLSIRETRDIGVDLEIEIGIGS